MARKTKSTKKTSRLPKAPATAAPQALGYSLQFTRLTAMLLAAPEGSMCSLEVLDDVAQTAPSGRAKVVQSKSARKANPVADHAVSLWKTLFNWVELVRLGLVVPTQTIFELYVSRKVEGELINAFHAAKSPEDARVAIRKARELLWGEAPGFVKKRELSEELARYANAVIAADEDALVPIILNLRLECGSGSPQTDIESMIRSGPVSDTKVFDIADKMCGWVKRQVDKQLERNLPANISREEFHREYVAYVRSVDRDLILKSLASKPSGKEKMERMPDTFVQQLDLIEFSFDEKLEAISDFLRACWDRTLWSKTGDVHEESFVELDNSLQRAWHDLNRVIKVDAATKNDVERGKLLQARCMLHQAKVQGMEPPAHFIPGCFHRLADDMIIGWHPVYRKLIVKAIAAAS